MSDLPPLKPLHSDSNLIRTKLALFERKTTEELKRSLHPAQEHCLKTRPDGTMLDGHHRVYVLRTRGEDVDVLPREIIVPDVS
jgi:hypothetical protein